MMTAGIMDGAPLYQPSQLLVGCACGWLAFVVVIPTRCPRDVCRPCQLKVEARCSAGCWQGWFDAVPACVGGHEVEITDYELLT